MNEKQKKIAIYVEGGPKVGLGHLSRCLGLAKALVDRQHSVVFLLAPNSNLSSRLVMMGFEWAFCSPSPGELVKICAGLNARMLVIDSYRFRGDELAKMEEDIPLLVFDDVVNSDLAVSIVVNGSPSAKSLSYRTKPTTKKLFGLEYQIIRPEFFEPVDEQRRQKIHTLLIMMGGDDLMGIAQELFGFFGKVFLPQRPEIEIHCIIGPHVRTLEGIDMSSFHVHHNPKDVRSIMMKADVAISAGGQTLFELARCGIPTIGFCVGEDQLVNLNALATMGMIDYVGWAKEVGWLEKLASSFDRIAQNEEIREDIRNKMLHLLDGKGAWRVAQAIETYF